MTMISINGERAHGRGAEFSAVVLGAAKRLILWPVHVARARRELAQLAAFSEYELRDIGLSAQDLRNATALPLDSDPTLFLAKRAAEHAEATWAVK